MDKIRAFIAIDLPPHVLGEIKTVTDDLKGKTKGLKWVRQEGIHLTLKFLGDITPDQADLIGKSLDEATAEFGSLELALDRPGAFPSVKRPRVIWVGLDGELEKLKRLQKSVEEACFSSGFDKDERPYSPHLTVARIKRSNRRWKVEAITDIIEKLGAIQASPFRVDALHLIQSELKPDGAVYTKLKTCSL